MVDWLQDSDQPLPRDWFGDETPPVSRTVEPFWIDVHPVTVAEFTELVRRTGRVTGAVACSTRKVRSYMNICIDGEMVDRHERATTDVLSGSTIRIIPPMACG
jgi:formylglycine-generating enzyme required for sulfatase activity